MQKTLIDKNVGIDLDVRYQTDRNGPWLPIKVIIDLQKFIDSKSTHLYVKKLVEISIMGSEVVSIEFNFSKELARELLDQAGRV